MAFPVMDAVRECAREIGIEVEVLSQHDTVIAAGRIVAEFGGRRIIAPALWERLRRTASVFDANAWCRMGEFLGDRRCIMLIDDAYEQQSALRFKSGKDLMAVLDRCSWFVYYIVDDECSFVLAQNDHDFLIAGGEAKIWLLSRFPAARDNENT